MKQAAHLDNSSLIELKDLAVKRGTRQVCQSVSFELSPGQVLFLKGANGSGKTTLLQALAGMRGESPLERYDLSISYIGHSGGLRPDLTVLENLRSWNQLLGKQGNVAEALDGMRLSHLQDKFVKNLSAGQRRQVSLARLSLAETDLWLLDEPVNHLDDLAAQHFWKLAEDFLQVGGMIIAAIHEEPPVLKGVGLCQLHPYSNS